METFWGTFGPVGEKRKPAKPARPPGRPRKDEGKKTVYLRVRLSEPHEAEIRAAAERVGLSISAWVTERLLKAARREAAEAAEAAE